jgi:inorganic pyrophosphatase
MAALLTVADLVEAHFPWSAWERLLQRRGVEIDRSAGTAHPAFPEVIYPLDYGFIPGTRARADDEPVDCFRGSAPERLGLVGLLVTEDHRQGKREFNLLYGTTPAEVYCAHGFLGFAPRLLESAVALRHPMPHWWNALQSPA